MSRYKLNKIKFTAVSLLILSLVLFLQLFINNSNHKSFVEKSKIENLALKNQINVILVKYDSISVLYNANANSKIYEPETFPSITSDKLEESKEVSHLKNEIDDDKKAILLLNKKLVQNTNKLNRLLTGEIKLKTNPTAHLNAINVKAKGVKIISDLYAPSFSKNMQQIRVCFTLEANEFIPQGDKNIYIQVLNPKNQIISTNNLSVKNEVALLKYSEEVTAFYNQNDTDVCAYVNMEKSKVIRGKYLVNIYSNFKKIGTTTLEYN
jgi:hypothetical protein